MTFEVSDLNPLAYEGRKIYRLEFFCYYDESVNDDGGYFRTTGMH